jgi:hypothetical protein
VAHRASRRRGASNATPCHTTNCDASSHDTCAAFDEFLKLLRRRIENEREPELRNNFDSAGNRIKASRRNE